MDTNDAFHTIFFRSFAHLLLHFVLPVQSRFHGIEELVLVDEAVRTLLTANRTDGVTSKHPRMHSASWTNATSTSPHNQDLQSETSSSARWAPIYNPPLFFFSSPSPAHTHTHSHWTTILTQRNSWSLYQASRWSRLISATCCSPCPASSASCPLSSPSDRCSGTAWRGSRRWWPWTWWPRP